MSRNPTELLTDRTSEVAGGRILVVNEKMLESKEDLLNQFDAGWETQRRYSPGYDWVIVSLKLPTSSNSCAIRETGPRSCPEHLSWSTTRAHSRSNRQIIQRT